MMEEEDILFPIINSSRSNLTFAVILLLHPLEIGSLYNRFDRPVDFSGAAFRSVDSSGGVGCLLDSPFRS